MLRVNLQMTVAVGKIKIGVNMLLKEIDAYDIVGINAPGLRFTPSLKPVSF